MGDEYYIHRIVPPRDLPSFAGPVDGVVVYAQLHILSEQLDGFDWLEIVFATEEKPMRLLRGVLTLYRDTPLDAHQELGLLCNAVGIEAPQAKPRYDREALTRMCAELKGKQLKLVNQLR